MKPLKTMLTLTLTAALSAVLLAGCGSAPSASNGGDKGTIVVGSKDFTENEVVAEIYALALEDAGYTVERKMDIASSVIHTSIVSGEIDLYPEYTGTGLLCRYCITSHN